MKLVYTLGSKHFNIKNLKTVSNIKITNKYQEQEAQKKLDKEIEDNSLFRDCRGIGSIKIYFDYEEKCEEIEIDGEKYVSRNYESFNTNNKNTIFSSLNNKYRVTKEKQREFNRFKKEAKELLKAFKEL